MKLRNVIVSLVFSIKVPRLMEMVPFKKCFDVPLTCALDTAEGFFFLNHPELSFFSNMI